MWVSDDWSRINFDTDTWISTMQDHVALFREHELSSPETPSGNDEQAVRLLMNGDASMTTVDALTYGVIRSQAPDMLDSGQIQFAPMWQGESGLRGSFHANTLGVTRPPNDADTEEWKKKQVAAIKFTNRLLTADFQRRVPDLFSGGLPAREDVWSDMESEYPGNYISSLSTTFRDAKSKCAHPDLPVFAWQIMGPTFQQAWLGEMTPEEACQQAAQQTRDQLDSF
jgi:ABC-type glycerol-3-phosphate transport system substrate-binding protein